MPSDMRLLSQALRAIKPLKPNSSKTATPPLPASPPLSSLSMPRTSPAGQSSSDRKSRSWLVYLILSTNPPFKTYVGVTNNFSRRLKQHNGELKGGAKASRAGRPWVCACLIRGFRDRSEACEFESKWKSLSRRLPRKRKNSDLMEQHADGSHLILLHRQAALRRVKVSLDCNHLNIDWQLTPS